MKNKIMINGTTKKQKNGPKQFILLESVMCDIHRYIIIIITRILKKEYVYYILLLLLGCMIYVIYVFFLFF